MRLKTIILLLFNWLVLITLTANATIYHDKIRCFLPDTLKLRTDTIDDSEEIESPIKYNASDSIVYETESQKIFLYGEATVDYSNTSLKAALIEIDNKNHLITAKGNADSTGKMIGLPVFKDPENEMRCEKIVFNTKTKKGKIYGVLTKQNELLIYGEAIKKDTNNVMYIKNAKCIPCEFEDAKFYFRASKAKVIPDDKIVTGPVFVEISNIKTPIGLPFGFFPNIKNKSKSGLIFPRIGQSPFGGFALTEGGWYFPINNKTEFYLTGDIYTNGSWALRTANNYKVAYKFSGGLNLSFMEIHSGEKEIPNNFKKSQNFSINWRHSQDGKSRPNDRFSANVNVVGNLNNKYSTSSSAPISPITNTFASNVSYNRSFSNANNTLIKNSNISINARHNQNTNNRSMEITFPELTYNLNRLFPFKNEAHTNQNCLDKLGVNYLMETRTSLRGFDTTILRQGNIDTNLLFGVRHSLPISTNFNLFRYFTFTPSANFSSVMFVKSIEKSYNEITKKIKTDTLSDFKMGGDATFSASLTTKIIGDYLFKISSLKQIRHLIIPTISFTYHPDMSKSELGGIKYVRDSTNTIREYSIFEKNIYTGPSAAESGSIGINLNNNFEAKVRTKSDSGYVYQKIFLLQNLSISGNYDLAAPKYKWSMVSVTGRTRIWKNLDLLGGADFDPYMLDAEGNRKDTLLYHYNQKIVRYSSGNLAANANFTTETFRSQNGNQSSNNSSGNWSLNLSYNILYSAPTSKVKGGVTQTFNINGNIGVTKNWRFGFSSGYDFKSKKQSYTTVTILRDLRCWQASIFWIPFGTLKQYSISINLKSSMFQSIKVDRNRNWLDSY